MKATTKVDFAPVTFTVTCENLDELQRLEAFLNLTPAAVNEFHKNSECSSSSRVDKTCYEFWQEVAAALKKY